MLLGHGRNQQHVWTVGLQIKPLALFFRQHRGREWPKRFTKLNRHIHAPLHCGVARITQNGAMPKRARTIFSATKKVPHYFSIRKIRRDGLDQLILM